MSGNEIQKIASIASKFLCPIQIKKAMRAFGVTHIAFINYSVVCLE